MNAEASERELIERALARPVSDETRATWGFTNRTDIITLDNGQRVVLQLYRRREDAEYRLRVMRGLQAPAAQAGIPLPRVRDYNLHGDPAWVIYDDLPGVPVPAAGQAPGRRQRHGIRCNKRKQRPGPRNRQSAVVGAGTVERGTT